MATWPATLPPPLAGSYREASPQTAVRTQMEVGPAKVRRRAAVGVRQLAFSMHLTLAELNTLRTFFETTTAAGALSFDYTHPVFGTAETARFISDNPPTWGRHEDGFDYLVDVNLELLP